MASTSRPSDSLSDPAERAFVDWLKRREAGDPGTIDALCAQHPELAERLSELHALHARGSALFAAFTPSGAEQIDPPSAGLPSARYELRARIAQGGMGLVYEVYDPSLRRTIAMKVLRGELDGAAHESTEFLRRRSRLLAEAQILAQLDHPGIVSIHEMGLDEHGRAYFTMKRVRGQEFEAVIRALHAGDKSWSLPRAVGALLKVCEAVAYAHEKGVIHRDLKPSNVMVGRFGEVFVMDWGLAKVLGKQHAPAAPRTGTVLVARSDGAAAQDSDGPSPSELSLVQTDRASDSSAVSSEHSPLATLHGDVVGTPAYMSPEQARGELDDIDARSDLYGVGALLYHLLAGQPPFAERPALPAAEIVARVRQGRPKPLASVARHAPEELVAICDKAMAREREQRYASMLEFADDLRAWLEGRVVRAHKTGAWIELRKWVRRNRSVAAAAVVAFVAVAAMAVVQTVLKRDVELAKRESDTRAEALRRDNCVQSIGLAVAASKAGKPGRMRELLDACPADLRRWEWRFLDARVDTSEWRVQLGTDWNRSTAFTPDGCSVLVTASNDMQLLDAASGVVQRVLEGAPSLVSTPSAFTADGTRLLVMGPGRKLHAWDAASWTALPQAIVQLPDTWTTISPSPRRDLLAVCSDGPAEIRKASDGSLVAVLDAGQDHVCCAWSGDDQRLYLGAWDGSLSVWDATTFELLHVAREHSNRINYCAASPDGRWLATSGWERRVFIWNTQSHEVVHRTEMMIEGPLAWSPDSSLLAAAVGCSISVLSAGDWRERMRLVGHDDPLVSLAFDRGGRRLVSNDRGGGVRLWDLDRRDRCCARPCPENSAARPPSFSRDGALVAVCWFDAGVVQMWSVPERRLLCSLQFGKRVSFADLSPDGERLLIQVDALRVKIVDARTGTTLGEIPDGPLGGSPFSPDAVRFSPDGSQVSIARVDGMLSVWDSRTFERVWQARACENKNLWPWSLGGGCWSPDGRLIATLPSDGRIQLWNAKTGAELREWRGHCAWSQRALFASDSCRLYVSGALSRGLECWDVERGECLFDVADEWASCLARGDDGERLFHVSGPSVHVRDARSGALLAALDLDPLTDHGFNVAPRGDVLVTASVGGLHFWDTRPWH